jgi:hypothetical protein
LKSIISLQTSPLQENKLGRQGIQGLRLIEPSNS